jgi:hypothetical protein
MFSHPGIEHLRPAGCGDVHVLQPSGVEVGRRSEWVSPAGKLPPHEEGYQAERENADADETDEDGRR